MGHRIRIINLHKSYRVNEVLVKKIVTRALKIIKKKDPSVFEIVFLTNAGIRALNRRYKREDSSTDVLSFDMGAGENAPLGEIFVSIDKARQNAKVFGTTPAEETILYVIHGMLHLYGYDDMRPGERGRMSRKQERILKILCTQENLSKVLTRR